MQILYTFLIGFLTGLTARAIKPGDDKMGFIKTALVGVVGSFIAGYAGQFLGFYEVGQTPGFIASVLGAIVVLVIYGKIQKKDANDAQDIQDAA